MTYKLGDKVFLIRHTDLEQQGVEISNDFAAKITFLINNKIVGEIVELTGKLSYPYRVLFPGFSEKTLLADREIVSAVITSWREALK